MNRFLDQGGHHGFGKGKLNSQPFVFMNIPLTSGGCEKTPGRARLAQAEKKALAEADVADVASVWRFEMLFLVSLGVFRIIRVRFFNMGCLLVNLRCKE